jgi:peptidoglycan hydrolase-like protein with peptidoglycan-binding domain
LTQLGSAARDGGSTVGSSTVGSGGRPVRRSRLARRRRVLAGVGIAAALLAVGGLIGAAFVKSPAQLAADTAPPAPTVTTAKVVSQVLTSSVQMRGVVYPATQYDVDATAPSSTATGSSAAGSSSTAGAASSQLYISKLDVAAGDTIRNGEQLAEIDGQPLFVLTGTVPAWEDLTPGESGPDVAELQQALASLGYYDDGDTPGYFGSATEDAVSLYYERLGYTPPVSGGVPAADVVFLPALPATVIVVNGATGEQPGQPFLELAARGSLALTGELPPAYAGQVKSGLKVKIYDEVTGIHATGTVAEVGTATTTVPAGATVDIGGSSASASASGAAGSGAAGSSSSTSSSSSASSSSSGSSSSGSGATPFIPLTVQPAKALRSALNGENVLVTVETGRTEGPVLTVPVAAIVTTASGTSRVTVVDGHGQQTPVAVTPGISENGYVQVTPVRPGALTAGDDVVVSG